MTTVLLTDDHPVVRTGMRALLEASGITVLAEACDGKGSLDQLAQLTAQGTPPDVVLMDLQMGGGMDGVTATTKIRQLPHAPHVLILTTYDTDTDILRAIEAGATGYLLKDAPPETLVEAVQSAARGQTVLAPSVAQRLVARLAQPSATLTPRELAVLRLVATGAGNRAIAKELFVSEATIKTHLVHINEKLGSSSRTDAVAKARAVGILR